MHLQARSYTVGPIESVLVSMNSGMYKNAFTCGIPNSNEVGNIFAAALGVVAGDSEKGTGVPVKRDPGGQQRSAETDR